MRRAKALVALLTLILLMTSCIKVDGQIVVEDDGSGSVDFLSALNTEALNTVLSDLEFPAEDLGSTQELCEGFETDFGVDGELPANAVETAYDQDGFCGSRVQFPLTSDVDHSGVMTGFLGEETLLYKDGDTWNFDTGLDLDDVTSEASGMPDAMTQALFGDSTFRISVDLPGVAVEGANNATEVGPDGLFIWDLDILNPPDRLFAQTEPGSGSGGGFSPLLLGLIVAGLLGAAALFMFLRQRNSSDADVSADADVQNLTSSAPTAVGAFDASTPTASGPPLAADPVVRAEPIAAAPQPDEMQPVFDAELGAWTVNHPTRGRLRHDPSTETWNPI